MDIENVFDTPKPIIGVVHLLPLPSSPRWGGNLQAAIDRAEQEATALAAGGVDGIIIENFFDAPFAKDHVDPAVVSAISLIAQRVKNLVMLPLGINVLRNDALSGMAIASVCGCQFIRVNVLAGVMVTDQGLIEGKPTSCCATGANSAVRFTSSPMSWSSTLAPSVPPISRRRYRTRWSAASPMA